MRPSLVVFDWDGTIADSKARIVTCLRTTIQALGADPRADDELAGVIGLGLPDSVLHLYPAGDADFVASFVATYRDRWMRPQSPPSRVFAGVHQTLEALRAAGVKAAVATGKGRRGLDRELAETGLTSYFSATRCADESRSKPDPTMLHELLAATGSTPGDTLMVGDSQWDLLMAHAASIRSVAVSYGTQPIDTLRAHNPWATIDAFGELLDLLDLD